MKKQQILDEMKQYALINNIPIIEDEGLVILEDIIVKEKPNRILEIGSAIGYSAIKMHLATNAKIFSIERNIEMYEEAQRNLKLVELQQEIKFINEDALLVENSKLGLFDVLYIDAAKSQYRRFFDKYKENVEENGIIVFDNLSFHGYVDMELEDIDSRNLRQLIRKIKEFIKYIKENEEYDFTLIKNGDGIGIARKKAYDGKINSNTVFS